MSSDFTPMPVPCNEQGIRRDMATAMPVGLRDTSGRTFDIVEWHPHVIAGECVTATIKVIVKVPKQ